MAATLLFHPSNTGESVILRASVVELGFDFLIDKAFVIFEVLLDVHLELDHVVENLFNLRVQFLAEGVGAQGQLFESGRVNVLVFCALVFLPWKKGEGVSVLDVGVHLPLLHQLDAFVEAGAHLGELLFHLLDLRVRRDFLSRCDLQWLVRYQRVSEEELCFCLPL